MHLLAIAARRWLQVFSQELDRLYEAELGKARQHIQQVAGASASVHQSAPFAGNFLATAESQDDGFDMRISVVAPEPLSPEVLSIVDKIEHKRATLEQRLVNEVLMVSEVWVCQCH
jgi:hypothetical protein